METGDISSIKMKNCHSWFKLFILSYTLILHHRLMWTCAGDIDCTSLSIPRGLAYPFPKAEKCFLTWESFQHIKTPLWDATHGTFTPVYHCTGSCIGLNH